MNCPKGRTSEPLKQEVLAKFGPGDDTYHVWIEYAPPICNPFLIGCYRGTSLWKYDSAGWRATAFSNGFAHYPFVVSDPQLHLIPR